MTAERESMTLQEMDAPALGIEERRDEAPGAGASHARPTPDPEVVAKPKRRKFTAQYRLRILEEAEWTLLTKVETSCDRILIAGGANVEAEWEQGPAV